MSDFETPMPSYRLAETHFNDDLQAVAARELGDANRWVELVWLNNLVHPYIVDDPRRVVDGVLLSGAMIKVPAPVGVWMDRTNRGQVYERDCSLQNRRLSVTATGDLAVVAGVDNLRQQISNRVVTPRGQLRRHPDYGCMIWRLVGTVNGPTAAKLGAEYVQAALLAEYRVRSVDFSVADVRVDEVKISARVRAIEGGVIDLITGNATS